MAAILIIDPDTNTRLRMCEALEAANHRCILAEDIAEGYEIAKHSTRMVTILNARLPWAESFTLLRLLEEKGCPLLFVTTEARNVRHLRALYQGPRGVMLAPFDANQLRQLFLGQVAPDARRLHAKVFHAGRLLSLPL